MSRKKAADIHALFGNPSNLGNLDNRDIKPDPIVPKAPKWLSKSGKKIWKTLSLELEKKALLTRQDVESFAQLCEHGAVAQESARLLRDEKNEYGNLLTKDEAHAGRLRRHPAWVIYCQATKGYNDIAKRFGLTPLDRIGLFVADVGSSARSSVTNDDKDEALFA